MKAIPARIAPNMLHENLGQLTHASAFSSETVLGKALRYPLRLLPPTLVVPILTGKLRGKRWIAGSFIHRCWMGVYESEKQDFIARSVRPGSVFYDVGANVGFYTLLGSLLVGTGKVFAFEPMPKNVSYLRKHIALNHLSNVEVFEFAITNENGSALFQIEETGAMGCLSNSGSVSVQTASLDSLLKQDRILPPNYIKMDIEGAEVRALQGAEQCIRRYRPKIFLATHGDLIHAECCGLLESWGFECQMLSDSSGELKEVFASPKELRDIA